MPVGAAVLVGLSRTLADADGLVELATTLVLENAVGVETAFVLAPSVPLALVVALGSSFVPALVLANAAAQGEAAAQATAVPRAEAVALGGSAVTAGLPVSGAGCSEGSGTPAGWWPRAAVAAVRSARLL